MVQDQVPCAICEGHMKSSCPFARQRYWCVALLTIYTLRSHTSELRGPNRSSPALRTGPCSMLSVRAISRLVARPPKKPDEIGGREMADTLAEAPPTPAPPALVGVSAASAGDWTTGVRISVEGSSHSASGDIVPANAYGDMSVHPQPCRVVRCHASGDVDRKQAHPAAQSPAGWGWWRRRRCCAACGRSGCRPPLCRGRSGAAARRCGPAGPTQVLWPHKVDLTRMIVWCSCHDEGRHVQLDSGGSGSDVTATHTTHLLKVVKVGRQAARGVEQHLLVEPEGSAIQPELRAHRRMHV